MGAVTGVVARIFRMPGVRRVVPAAGDCEESPMLSIPMPPPGAIAVERCRQVTAWVRTPW
jgi:hypothetical protein